MDRNDELLVLCGWKILEHPKARATFWENPQGRISPDPPRPYDNLQDAVDLVRGAEVTVKTFGDWPTDHPDEQPYATVILNSIAYSSLGSTPAEALSEAIMKALSND